MSARCLARQIGLLKSACRQAFTNCVQKTRRKLLSASAISAAAARRCRPWRIRGAGLAASRRHTGTLTGALTRTRNGAGAKTAARWSGRRGRFRWRGELGESGHTEHQLKRWRRRTSAELQIERRGHESKLGCFDPVVTRRESGKFEPAGLVGPADENFPGVGIHEAQRGSRNRRAIGGVHGPGCRGGGHGSLSGCFSGGLRLRLWRRRGNSRGNCEKERGEPRDRQADNFRADQVAQHRSLSLRNPHATVIILFDGVTHAQVTRPTARDRKRDGRSPAS